MTTVPLVCSFCKEPFTRSIGEHNACLKKGLKPFCSLKCSAERQIKQVNVTCRQCGVEFKKRACDFKRSPNHYCSRRCSVTYSNLHKTHGIRRSKLEAWLEQQLRGLYPSLEIICNQKTVINSELDIYIPSLKLAFELNGIFHYEPIYGPEKLAQIQNNDGRKFQACLEQGIELCIIDSSKQAYFSVTNSQHFLGIITKLINEKILTVFTVRT